MRALLLFLPALLAGCEMAPRYVEGKDIDDAMAYERYKTVCVGLKMKDDDVRRYAADKLETVSDPQAAECICAQISGQGGWDPAIAEGLAGTKRDDLVECFAKLVEDPALPKRVEAIVALGRTDAPATKAALGRIASAPGDTAARVQAIKALGGDEAWRDALMGMLSESDPALRAAAAEALATLAPKDAGVLDALTKAATTDTDGDVRASALAAARHSGPSSDGLACTAMMDDPSPAVRRAAVSSFRGTRSKDGAACLRKRALAKEDDAEVREAVLSTLKSSPIDESAAVLCDAIPFWMRTYVDKDLPDKLPGTMIVKAQNDRDWERSYECVGKALKAGGGYSCYAKMHLGLWYRELGGSAYVPRCPGYEGSTDDGG